MIMPPMPPMDNPLVGAETFYTLVVIAVCLAIYLKTRRMYKLTYHQGLFYFSNAFLFFALSFLSRFFLRFRFPPEAIPAERMIFSLGYLLFFYTGVVAAFMLLYSTMWKKTAKPTKRPFYNILFLALLTSLIATIALPFPPAFVTFMGIIFVGSSALSYLNYKASEKKDRLLGLYAIYALLLLAFVANAISHFAIFISSGVAIFMYVLSIAAFLAQLYLVFSSSKSKKKGR